MTEEEVHEVKKKIKVLSVALLTHSATHILCAGSDGGAKSVGGRSDGVFRFLGRGNNVEFSPE